MALHQRVTTILLSTDAHNSLIFMHLLSLLILSLLPSLNLRHNPLAPNGLARTTLEAIAADKRPAGLPMLQLTM